MVGGKRTPRRAIAIGAAAIALLCSGCAGVSSRGAAATGSPAGAASSGASGAVAATIPIGQFGTGVAILTSVIPAERRGAAIGFNVSAVYFGLTFGPLLGGWATHYLSWRSVFLVHVPLAIVNLFIVATMLKGEWKNEQKQRFDYAGAVFYSTSIVGLMYGISRLPAEIGFGPGQAPSSLSAYRAGRHRE